MTPRSLFLLAVSVGLLASVCQASDATHRDGNASHASGLVLHAELVDQSICQDSVTLSVQMHFKLRFVNSSKSRIILSKQIPDPSLIRVAKNAQEAENGHFEY
jgi:hypothetical protein